MFVNSLKRERGALAVYKWQLEGSKTGLGELRFDIVGAHGEQFFAFIPDLIERALVGVEKLQRAGVEHKYTIGAPRRRKG